MSGSGGSSDSSKKLIHLILYLSIIPVLLALIFAIGLMLNDTSPDTPGLANNTSHNPLPAIYSSYIASEGPLKTLVMEGNATCTSLFKSMVLVLATDGGARWLDANPDWRLFEAQAGNIDGKGLARHWNLVVRSQDSILIAYVDNGIASIQSIDDYGAGDLPRLEYQALMDSNYLLDNVTRVMGIGDGANATQFSLTFQDDGADGTYRLSYTDPVNPDASFTQTYSAKNGETIEDAI